MQTNIVTVGLTVLFGLDVSGPYVPAQESKPPADRFAQIAAIQTDYGRRDLISIAPEPLVRRLLPPDGTATAGIFQPAAKITNAEQLREELQRQRELHAPYLRDLAPPLDAMRIRVPLESFDWRAETEEDRRDFAGTLAGHGTWQQVTIPHYGPPMGRAVTYYRTAFEVTPEMLAKGALFIHFQGVDYKANVLVTYLNEPYPGCRGVPHVNMTREELTQLFEAADIAVRLANPDRVIKAVDGDYDPPGPGMPDNHCYTGWYNGHGVEMGALHKGYWQGVKPGWVYGCGEFGAEGLDPADLGAAPVFTGPVDEGDAILIDDLAAFGKVEPAIAEAVRAGAHAVFLELPPGKHQIARTEVTVDGTPTELHFVSRATGHRFVEGFQPEDFKFWYDARVDHPTPLLKTPGFQAGGWEPVLLTHNVMAAGCKPEGKGCWCVCQVELAGRTTGNAVASIFARRLLGASSP